MMAQAFHIVPSTRANRLLFGLISPFLPASVKSKFNFCLAGDERAHVARVLGDEAAVPDFFGGPACHPLPPPPPSSFLAASGASGDAAFAHHEDPSAPPAEAFSRMLQRQQRMRDEWVLRHAQSGISH